MKTFLFFCQLLRTSIRASLALRAAFLLELVLMLGNNLIFFFLWWIFFLRFNDISGWKINDIAASMAILSGAYGLAQICFGGLKNLGITILNGDLDSFMTQPKNLLLHLLGSKSRSKGWGHLATTLILIFLGDLTSQIPLLLLVILSGSVIYVSFGILVQSLTFWFGPLDSVASKYLDSLFVFALYPTNIYSGLLQLVMFTIIPAGLIGYVPVELLRKFSWDRFFILIASALTSAIFAYWVFHRGLKRYESGNKFGMRL